MATPLLVKALAAVALLATATGAPARFLYDASRLVHADVLIGGLDFMSTTNDQKLLLSTAVVSVIATACGTPISDVLDIKEDSGASSLAPGNTKFPWAPATWPVPASPSTLVATFVNGVPPAVVYSQLSGATFQQALVAAVTQVLGKSNAVIGTISVLAVDASPLTPAAPVGPTATPPWQANPTATGSSFPMPTQILVAVVAVLGGLVVLIFVCRGVYSACMGDKQYQEMPQQNGFLAVGQYDEQGRPVYNNPTRVLAPGPHQGGFFGGPQQGH